MVWDARVSSFSLKAHFGFYSLQQDLYWTYELCHGRHVRQFHAIKLEKKVTQACYAEHMNVAHAFSGVWPWNLFSPVVNGRALGNERVNEVGEFLESVEWNANEKISLLKKCCLSNQQSKQQNFTGDENCTAFSHCIFCA